MGEIGRWCGQKFVISSSVIRGFTGLQIKGSLESESKEEGGQQYVSRKKGKATEIQFTIKFNAYTGCAVRKEALWFVGAARKGNADYLYLGGTKYLPYKLMCTDATIKNVVLSPSGKWESCDVAVTLKQCQKAGGGSGGNGGGGGTGNGGGSGGNGGGGGGTKGTKGPNKVSVDKSPTVDKKTETEVVKKIEKYVRDNVAPVVKKAVPVVKKIVEDLDKNRKKEVKSKNKNPRDVAGSGKKTRIKDQVSPKRSPKPATKPGKKTVRYGGINVRQTK
ncbi:MAG: hypothetical protein Q4B09_05395 [Lachnospiraceae bacterium]|nr:hypothetical protein [Lachnospiraceae bacterium]